MKKHIILFAVISLAACGAGDKAEMDKQHSERRAAAKTRFEQWAYVAKEKQIGPGETIKLVIIPDPQGIDFFDTKCLIYTNAEFKQSSMICPDADKESLKASEE
ncbi:MAG: hypothetical protein WA056_09095 [Gallionella sp.]